MSDLSEQELVEWLEARASTEEPDGQFVAREDDAGNWVAWIGTQGFSYEQAVAPDGIILFSATGPTKVDAMRSLKMVCDS